MGWRGSPGFHFAFFTLHWPFCILPIRVPGGMMRNAKCEVDNAKCKMRAATFGTHFLDTTGRRTL